MISWRRSVSKTSVLSAMPAGASTRSHSSKLDRGPATVPYGYGVRTRTRIAALTLVTGSAGTDSVGVFSPPAHEPRRRRRGRFACVSATNTFAAGASNQALPLEPC